MNPSTKQAKSPEQDTAAPPIHLIHLALWLRMQIALDLWEAERDEDVKKVKPLPAA